MEQRYDMHMLNNASPLANTQPSGVENGAAPRRVTPLVVLVLVRATTCTLTTLHSTRQSVVFDSYTALYVQ